MPFLKTIQIESGKFDSLKLTSFGMFISDTLDGTHVGIRSPAT